MDHKRYDLSKILVTGASGIVGKNVCIALRKKKIKFKKLSSFSENKKFLLEKKKLVFNLSRKISPTLIIHCAIDDKLNPNFIKNVKMIKNLTKFFKAPIIYMSSVAVYENIKKEYLSENIKIKKLSSQYAKVKKICEDIVLSRNIDNDESAKIFISPWTIPGYDFTNLINQYSIFNMLTNGKKSKKNNKINIAESNTLDLVDWDIFNPSILKNLNILLNKFAIDKLNEYKNKVNQYKSNMISIKKVRKAEKLLSNIYSGFILSVQSYGFFVEISELNVEGLVHVSTLNNDWYEYRSRQNLLIGRKSKKSYKVGDQIEVKIIKVDILKYQIDLELT